MAAPTCWASSLSPCGEGFSNEHFTSKALWKGGMVRVTGLPWCEGVWREVSSNSIAAHILCGRHNNALSELDSAAGRTFEHFGDALRLIQQRKADPKGSWVEKTFEVDAPKLLERWFLKTMLNLLQVKPHELRWRIDGGTAREFPDRIVRLAFGQSLFERPMGLYMAANTGARVALVEGLEFAPLTYDGPNLVGGVFRFAGWSFVLHLEPTPLPPTIPLGHFGEVARSMTGVHYHGEGFRYHVGQRLSHTVNFQWGDAVNSRGHR